jgi:hypothetical protein
VNLKHKNFFDRNQAFYGNEPGVNETWKIQHLGLLKDTQGWHAIWLNTMKTPYFDALVALAHEIYFIFKQN